MTNQPNTSTSPQLPWLQWQPGDRVVVRYRAPDGIHDALGTLIETTHDHVVIEARRGKVRVDAESMIIGRLVTKKRPVDINSGRDASAQQS